MIQTTNGITNDQIGRDMNSCQLLRKTDNRHFDREQPCNANEQNTSS